MAQPLKKKEVKTRKSSIADFKKKNNFEMNNADKEMEWLIMPEAYQEALKLPGIPLNYFSILCGHSNTGKSTLINHIIVAAQKQGYCPVIFDTENNFDWTYAIDMGMEAEPVEGDIDVEVTDPETGEISIETKRGTVSYEGNFIYFNNNMLCQKYGNFDHSTGKVGKGTRKVAVIEDIAMAMNELLNAQDEGELDMGLVFVWDSIGSIGCYKSYKSASNNAQWDAAAISVAFQQIVNNRIPSSKKVVSPYNNAFIATNKVWLDNSKNPMPGAPPSLSLKGGQSMFYAARLIILCGGQLTSGAKRLTATAKGRNYNFAIQTKLKVLKNQLPAPFTVSYEGEVICTPHGMISTDKEALESYKKEHIGEIIKNLNSIDDNNFEKITDASEVSYDISETDEIG